MLQGFAPISHYGRYLIEKRYFGLCPQYDEKRQKAAFTLAEVLITLGIIGVVAAMTLPAVINTTRNKELETGLKKGASVLTQAFDMYQAEHGDRILPVNVGLQELKSIIMPYFKTAKDCGYGSGSNTEDVDKACIKNYANQGQNATVNNSNVYRNFTNTNYITLTYFDDGQAIAVDGMLILIENAGGGYGNQIYISVDVNGAGKRPNMLGQDLFMFELGTDGILRPMGAKGTTYYSANDRYCSLSSSEAMNVVGCTYKALTDKDFFKNLPK